MSTAAAVVLVVAITLYAVFGGADFGAGFWDLVAGGARRGERPRGVIDHSIAPVWEANHVWLIFVFVVLWTCFPQAYASITLTMFVPLTLAALGVVLRGAGFAFRKAVLRTRDRRDFGAAFAVASVLVPYSLGAVIGGVASGRVPAGGVAGDPWSSWVNPTSVVAGLLAVSLCAYLAAFFLVVDARRLVGRRDGGVLPPSGNRRRGRGRCRRRSRALRGVRRCPLRLRRAHLPRAAGRRRVCGVRRRGAGAAAAPCAPGRPPRCGAGGRVGHRAWAVAQWDYLLPETLTVSAGAAPTGTITAVLVATGARGRCAGPAFGLLYVLDQKSLLPDEGVPEVTPTP